MYASTPCTWHTNQPKKLNWSLNTNLYFPSLTLFLSQKQQYVLNEDAILSKIYTVWYEKIYNKIEAWLDPYKLGCWKICQFDYAHPDCFAWEAIITLKEKVVSNFATCRFEI